MTVYFVGSGKGGLFGGIRKASRGEGCHTCTGFQRMGKTVPDTGHYCQGDNRAKEIRKYKAIF